MVDVTIPGLPPGDLALTSLLEASNDPGSFRTSIQNLDEFYQLSDEKNATNGYAGLISGLLDVGQIPTGIPAINIADGSVNNTNFQRLGVLISPIEEVVNRGEPNGYPELDELAELKIDNFPSGNAGEVLRRNDLNLLLEFADPDTFAITTINGDDATDQFIAGTTNKIVIISTAATTTINIGSLVVATNQDNTYTAGNKQSFVASTSTAGLNINDQVPSGLVEGDIFRDEDELLFRGDATTFTLVTTVSTQTLTNKSIDLSDNPLSGTITDFNNALALDDFATLLGSETLENKTLITPTIGATGFVNMQHTHETANTGGKLTASDALDASGTPSATTFLRGDDSWTNVPIVGSIDDLSDVTIDTPSEAQILIYDNVVSPRILRNRSMGGDATLGFTGDLVINGNFATDTDNLGFFSSTLSSQLFAIMQDPTGGGALVFAISPTIVTPVIVSFETAQHNHEAAAGGGTLDSTAALSDTANIAYLDTDNLYGDGKKQSFNPDSTTAGLNVGSEITDPTGAINGDIYYNSDVNELRARIGGFFVPLGIGATELNDLSDVTIGGGTLNDLLVSDVEGEWLNRQGQFVGITGLGTQTFDLNMGDKNVVSISGITFTSGSDVIEFEDDNTIDSVLETLRFRNTLVNRYTFDDNDANFLSHNLILGAAYIDFTEIDKPDNPGASNGRLYIKDVAGVTTPFFLDTLGNDTNLLVPVFALDDLTDVTIDTPLEDNLLEYNGTVWENKTGFFAGIEGVGQQKQLLDMGSFSIFNIDVLELDTATTAPGDAATAIFKAGFGFLVFNAPEFSGFEYRVNGISEYTYSAATANFLGNMLLNVGELLTGIEISDTLTDSFEIRLNKERATDSVPVTNSSLGRVTFYGADDAIPNFDEGGRLEFLATQLWTGANHGTRFELSTTENNNASPTVRLTIEEDGTADFTSNDIVNAGGIQTEGRLQESKGATIVSADVITLGADGNSFLVSGVVDINHMTNTGWQAGSVVTLIFSDILTVVHASGGVSPDADFDLKGGNDFVTVAGSTLTLIYNGTVWQEFNRSITVSTQTVLKTGNQDIDSADEVVDDLDITLPNRPGGFAVISVFLLTTASATDQTGTFEILDDTVSIGQRVIRLGNGGDVNEPMNFTFTVPLDGSVIAISATNSDGTFVIQGGGSSNEDSSALTSFEVG